MYESAVTFSPYYGSVGHGSLSFAELSPAQSITEPLTLAQVKKYLNLPDRSPADSAEDLELMSMISGAREQAEIAQGRDIVRKTWDLSLDYWPGYQVELRDPLVSVDLVKCRDSAGAYTVLAENIDYVVDTAKHPGVIVAPYGKTWSTYVPWPSSSLLIRFTSGYAATSQWWLDRGGMVRNGMLMLISAWFNNKIPFEVGIQFIAEYPMAITACLSAGALERVR